ncbi:unnamed protein product, partial [Ascophyllum nodosum]
MYPFFVELVELVKQKTGSQQGKAAVGRPCIPVELKGHRLYHKMGVLANEVEVNGKRPPEPSVVVGFAFMAKKMDSMAKVVSVGPRDGVEFCQLDFSRRPDEHRPLDVILHKLSDDIMFRGVRPEGHARLKWIEQYTVEHPQTVLVDPIDKVANVINRVATLKLLTEAYGKYGTAGGMPRPPRFVVYEDRKVVPKAGMDNLAFPVICKPIDACAGSRGSHTMVVVLDRAGMGALKPPIVVQEFSNHGGKLFKVCVVGEEVRVHERLSLPDLSPELVGSFTFDSQKAYPTLAEVGFLLFVINSAKHTLCRALASSFRTSGSPVVPNEMILENTRAPPYSTPLSRIGSISEATTRTRDRSRTPLAKRKPGDATNASPPSPAVEIRFDRMPAPLPMPSTAKAGTAKESSPAPSFSLKAAKIAADRMRETFGLTIFGFDLIVDRASGEAMVIDVNYFPSFKDIADFPQVLR